MPPFKCDYGGLTPWISLRTLADMEMRDAPAAGEATEQPAPPTADAAFDRAFSLVAFAMNRHLVDHWIRASRFFDLDFEALTIWAVLAHQNVAHLMPPGSTSTILNERGRLKDEIVGGLRPVRLRDMSQITGIPRETVRRKLEKLRERNWVLNEGDGWRLNRAHGDAELREFTREAVRRFMATAGDMDRALRDARNAVEKERARRAP